MGLVEAWVPPEGAERLGCLKLSTSTRTSSTLTPVGEPLDDDESSFEGAILEGPAKPLGPVLEGPAEPLGPVVEGPAEPLGPAPEGPVERPNAALRGSAEPREPPSGSEHSADPHGTRASADAGINFTEEA